MQGISRALGEEVTWDNRRITSVDWRAYHSLSVGHAAPAMEVVLINQPDEEACGAGETSITVAAPAIGNAVFDAIGQRLDRRIGRVHPLGRDRPTRGCQHPA